MRETGWSQQRIYELETYLMMGQSAHICSFLSSNKSSILLQNENIHMECWPSGWGAVATLGFVPVGASSKPAGTSLLPPLPLSVPFSL